MQARHAGQALSVGYVYGWSHELARPCYGLVPYLCIRVDTRMHHDAILPGNRTTSSSLTKQELVDDATPHKPIMISYGLMT